MSKTKPPKISINDFSEHLFWDIDHSKLDFEKNKFFIIKRTLQYGLINDWEIIQKVYGLDEIGQVATNIKDLDAKTASFISLICEIPKRKFVCYTHQQSMPKHWNF